MNKYNFNKIEKFSIKNWKINKTFEIKKNSKLKKYYCLPMFPYPSGNLHIGHIRNYTACDIISRFQRMLGKNVLHPIGWDAFGLPAENASILNNSNPKIWTDKNIKFMKKQLKRLGYSYDWTKEINTCHPSYYRWEQLLFIILYKKKLIYRKKSTINWCEYDNTVLANEQVINGMCWRCNNKITYKKIHQWFVKSKIYAEDLLNDLKYLNMWPKKVLKIQKNWIGKFEKIEIKLKIKKINEHIFVYLNNLKDLLNLNYILITFDHSLINLIKKNNLKLYNLIKKYEEKNVDIKKTNMKFLFIKLYAINPINKNLIPIIYTNFLSVDNDLNIDINLFDFKKKNNFEIFKNFSNDYLSIYKNVKNNVFIENIQNDSILKNKIKKLKISKKKTFYKLKDWCISRQRYWGVPIPIVYINKKIKTLKKEDLPLVLPKNKNKFNLKYYDEWVNCKYNGINAVRETDTLDTFLESSWYYYRYTCNNYKLDILDKKSVNYWLKVDKYIGGIEHATMHLLYLRLIHKIFRSIGLVNTKEPIKELVCQGMILSKSYYYYDKNNKKVWVNPNDIHINLNKENKILSIKDKVKNKIFYNGIIKMSKSKNNGVDVNKLIKKYGADTLRLFTMSLAPLEKSVEWNESGIVGMTRFLNKIWEIFNTLKISNYRKKNINFKKLDKLQYKLIEFLNLTIINVTKCIKNYLFNVAISSIIKFTNYLKKSKKIYKKNYNLFTYVFINLLKILYPFAPHLSFYLLNKINIKNVDFSKWPNLDKYVKLNDKFNLILVQINGKKYGVIKSKVVKKSDIYNKAIKLKIIKNIIDNRKVKKVVFIKNKVINFVV
ncbi:MAG: leucine--tRNA ligase [Enterobacteriaceae bacterium]